MTHTHRILFAALWFLSVEAFAQSTDLASPAERRDFRSFSIEGERTNGETTEQQGTSGPITGVVLPRHQLTLSIAVSGVVSVVAVAEGDAVASGDLLIALEQDLETLELQRLELVLQNQDVLQASRERLDLMQEQLNLAQRLYDESRSISRDELNALRMQWLGLQADMANLTLEKQRQALDLQMGQGLLDQRNLRAPRAGLITRVAVEPGEWVQSGEPIIELIDSQESLIRFSLPSRQIRTIALGDEVRFRVEDIQGIGWVSYIAPFADAASGRIEVRITFDNSNQQIRPGLSADIFL